MKKLLAILVLFFAVSTSFANPPVTEKVLKQFTALFPEVQNARWFENGDYYDVYFEKDRISYHVRYNQGGKMVSTRNYYPGEKLCPFLKAKVAEKYPSKSIFGVTEITNSDEMYCIINLEDSKGWTNIRIDATGQINELEKLSKGEK